MRHGLELSAVGDLDVLALLHRKVDQPVPDVGLAEGPRVPDDHEEVLRPGDGDVEAPLVEQEAQALLEVGFAVAADAVEDDDVLLLPLKGVDGVDFNVGWIAVDLPKPCKD